MQKEALDYLNTQRVGVLAVEMLDGSPHAATVHFAHSENPLIFYFQTSKLYRKSEALLGREFSRASFVVGSDESNMKTLQLDGDVRILSLDDSGIDGVYFARFPDKKEKAMSNPGALFITFTPKWWRFTDWTTPEGKKIWTSDSK